MDLREPCPLTTTAPERIALITEERSYSYQELHNLVNQCSVDGSIGLERKGNVETIVILFALMRRGLAIDFSQPVPFFSQNGNPTINLQTPLFFESSGTTGAPKKVEWTLGNFIRNLRSQFSAFPSFQNASHRARLDWSRMGGFSALMRPLFSGGTVVLDPTIEVDFESVVPTQIVKRFPIPFATKTILVGGAPLPDSTALMLKQMAHSVVHLYSSTELGTCLLNGIPLPGVEIEIDPENCLWIRKIHTAKHVECKIFYQTFDRVKQPHAPFDVVGRTNRVIYTGGEKVLLSYIEEKLQELLPHGIFHAFATPDPFWGEALALGFANESPLIIEEVLRRALPRYMIPKHFIHLPLETPPKPSLKFLQSLISPSIDPEILELNPLIQT